MGISATGVNTAIRTAANLIKQGEGAAAKLAKTAKGTAEGAKPWAGGRIKLNNEAPTVTALFGNNGLIGDPVLKSLTEAEKNTPRSKNNKMAHTIHECGIYNFNPKSGGDLIINSYHRGSNTHYASSNIHFEAGEIVSKGKELISQNIKTIADAIKKDHKTTRRKSGLKSFFA